MIPAPILAIYETSGHKVEIVLFHNYLFPSGEHPNNVSIAYKQNNQLPVVWQYFTSIAAI